MVARYVLSYVPSPSQDQDGEITTLSPDLLEGMTTQDAFQILFDLANKDEFEAAFFWLGTAWTTLAYLNFSNIHVVNPQANATGQETVLISILKKLFNGTDELQMKPRM